jgi:tRNA threonylcarbamoyladenosine biosynthesis protein TsaE
VVETIKTISQEYPLGDALQTERLGRALAQAWASSITLDSSTQSSAVIYLNGELGAGKTTLVRAWLQALGVQGRIKSPSFALVETYQYKDLALMHVDCYRMSSPLEWLEAGFAEQAHRSALVLIEWPQMGKPAIPAPTTTVDLTISEDTLSRIARIEGFGIVGDTIVKGIVF